MTTPPRPSRADVREVLLKLLAGRISRENAAAWAVKWVIEHDDRFSDQRVWDAVVSLSGADMTLLDGGYVHDENNIRSWLDELDSAPPES